MMDFECSKSCPSPHSENVWIKPLSIQGNRILKHSSTSKHTDGDGRRMIPPAIVFEHLIFSCEMPGTKDQINHRARAAE